MDIEQLKYYLLYKVSYGETRRKCKIKYLQKKNYLYNFIREQLDNITLKSEEYIRKELGNIALKNELDVQKQLKDLKKSFEVQKTQEKSFQQYENIHEGKDVVIIATGPSLSQFKPISNAVYVGLNRAFLADQINLDYLFMQDYSAVKDYIDLSLPYKNPNLKRFYGILDPEFLKHFYGVTDTEYLNSWPIPTLYTKRHNASRYYVKSVHFPNKNQQDLFTDDITLDKLICYGSVVFPALQFILFTNPKRIYLVGCDCVNNGQFNDSQTQPDNLGFVNLKHGWDMFKIFVEERYPNLEIISVNPIGLKGMFTDLEQRE